MRCNGPLTSHSLARLLKPYGIRPRSIRIGPQTPKGYLCEDFSDAWGRYTPDLSATTQQPDPKLETTVLGHDKGGRVADTEPLQTGLFKLDVADVADSTPNHWGDGRSFGSTMDAH